MHSIGTIAANPSGLDQITSHLPWGWFTLMGIVDLALVAVIVSRRVGSRHAAEAEVRLRQAHADALVRRSGWWVPRARVLELPLYQASYAWPLHREYMVRRVV